MNEAAIAAAVQAVDPDGEKFARVAALWLAVKAVGDRDGAGDIVSAAKKFEQFLKGE
jgi:hypothetical protein